MTLQDIDWQEVLTFAALATAAGFLVLRAHRAANRKQPSASCGACSASPGRLATGDCGAGRGYPVSRNEAGTPTPTSSGRKHR